MAEGWTVDKLKNTLDYLKNAIKGEREERKSLKSKLEELSEKVLETEKSLKEKVRNIQIHQISILNLVTQDLDHKIKKLEMFEGSSSNKDHMTDSRGLFLLEQQNSKLKEDNSQLIKENLKLAPSIENLEK
jgi:hypothetical protein